MPMPLELAQARGGFLAAEMARAIAVVGLTRES